VIDSVIKKLIHNKKYTIPQEQLFVDQTGLQRIFCIYKPHGILTEMYYASRCMEQAYGDFQRTGDKIHDSLLSRTQSSIGTLGLAG
jgi:hypothetical protein